MNKAALLVVAGAGYVLGSRAGRERYEQIKNQAGRVWNSQAAPDAAGHEQPSTIAPGQGTA